MKDGHASVDLNEEQSVTDFSLHDDIRKYHSCQLAAGWRKKAKRGALTGNTQSRMSLQWRYKNLRGHRRAAPHNHRIPPDH